MVGLFNLGNKQLPTAQSRPGSSHHQHDQHALAPPPPPPYNESRYGSPVLVSETTTTTQVVTTTQTTTHFFSLPLWRRRPGTASSVPSARQSIADPHMDEMGHLAPSMRVASGPLSFSDLKTNKALPPTPAVSDEWSTSIPIPVSAPRVESPAPFTSHDHDSLDGSALSAHDLHTTIHPPDTERQPSLSGHAALEQPKFAIARAALGLGLPHVMPQQLQAERASVSLTPAVSGMRRVKSFHRSEGLPSDDTQESTPRPSTSAQSRRRTRGLSLGPWSLGIDTKVKGKGKEDDVAPSPTLSRKGSFFSRRRKDSKVAPPVPPSPVPARAPMEVPWLPQVPLISPLNVDSHPMSSAVGLLRRANSQRDRRERTSSQQSMSMLSFMQNNSPPASPIPPLPEHTTQDPSASDKARLQPRRPQTADSAAERTRAYSMFLGSSPGGAFGLMTDPSLSSRSTITNPAPDKSQRRRSQTNPLWPSFTNTPSGSTAVGSASPSPRVSLNKPSAEQLKPQTQESPELYLHRLSEIVSKAEIAGVLATSAGPFHATALRTYIGRFNFINDPLDIAIRKLLMDVGLPRETQQIDRVIEAFAARYSECNPNLFGSEDQAYVLAFSLIMLHTDAFNKSNKRKMTKVDYVKNTRLPGVPPEVLEYFFDNIVFAPFIYIEDSEDVDGSHAVPAELTRMSSFGPPSVAMGTAMTPGGSVIIAKGPKIDPYYLIARGMLDPFRVPTERHVQWETPYSFHGTAGPWDEEVVRLSFINAEVVQVSDINESQLSNSPYFSIAVTGGPLNPMGSILPAMPITARQDTWSLKVTKVGALQRKDDIADGGRRAPNRKWREWTVILTGSQLLFFRDPTWANTFLSQDEGAETPSSLLRPDELLSVKDAVAVYDRSYHKYPNCLRFVMPNGRHILLRAADQAELNEWIARINYASAFKTAGVRMRPTGMSQQDIELTGIAAAASHIKSAHHYSPLPLSIRRWDAGNPRDMRTTQERQPSETLRAEPEKPRRSFDRRSSPQLDTEVVLPPQLESGPQFKAIFDQTKSDLASHQRHGRSNSTMTTHTIASTIGSPKSPVSISEHAAYPSRASVIRSKIDEIKSRLVTTQAQLDTDMRFVRNIAILTPFQHATRERLDAAVQAVAKKILVVRLEVAKLACHCQVLEDDLASARREWRQTKAVALQAALNVIKEAATPEPEIRAESPTELACDEEAVVASAPMPIPRPRSDVVDLARRDSSLTGSFYSATDFGPEWSTAASTEDDPPAIPTDVLASPEPEAAPSPNLSQIDEAPGYPFPPTTPARPPRLSIASSQHERFYTAVEGDEQAEEWNKTQAARRVSLVKLPSDLRIANIFRRSRGSPALSTPDSPRRSRDSART